MQVKIYGIYDGVAKEFVQTIASKDDDTAARAVKYIVRDPNFDRIAGKDYVLQYIYTWESSTGVVIDNEVRAVCSFAQALDELETEELNNKIKAKLVEESEAIVNA